MEKSMKWIAGIASFLALGYILYKKYKRELSNIEKAEKKAKEDFKDDLGLKVSKLDAETCVDDVFDFSKSMYISARFGDKFDGFGDVIDPSECFNYPNVVHVYQDGSDIVFGFEIPEVKHGAKFYNPMIGDYIRAFTGISKELLESYGLQKRYSSLCGYYLFSYNRLDDNNNERSKIKGSVRIPEEHYEKYADRKHDGLTEYIELIRDEDDLNESLDSVEIDDFVESDKEYTDISVDDVILMFELHFPIYHCQSYSKSIGVYLEALKWIVNNLEVSKDRSEYNTVRYDHIIFHPIGNLRSYWDTDKNNNVINFFR